MLELNDLLEEVVERDASDLHLKVGQPPILRVYGSLIKTDYPALTAEDTKRLVYSILDEAQQRRFEQFHELDLGYELPERGRFRVNIFHQRGMVGAAMRLIPLQVGSIEELGLPQILKTIAMRPRGFVLVTGPTGCGKTTTLAATINYINETAAQHIVTVEEPIEFLHREKKSAISQRELGIDTKTYHDALRHVMRQNPDIIMVAEMRDLQTIALAVTAAETGHLVFSTLHTIDAPQTIDRVIDVFPPDQQEQIRLQLSTTLEAIFCETLLPRADGKGRVPAFEILIATPAIRAIIRAGRTYQLYSIIQSSADLGMQTMDQSLADLYRRGLVTYEDGVARATSRAEFDRLAGR